MLLSMQSSGRLLRQPGGIETVATQAQGIESARARQVAFHAEEPSVAQPKAGVDLALQSHAARASLCPDESVNKDAIIANRPRLLDHVAHTLPVRKPLRKEGHQLLASVAWPRRWDLPSRVVVALGLPESGDPRRELFRGRQMLLQVAPGDLDVLL